MAVSMQIGNTDGKLTQAEWSDFVIRVKDFLDANGAEIHFFGAPPNYERWQNAAWIFNATATDIGEIRLGITQLRSQYGQDSVAWLEGATQFI